MSNVKVIVSISKAGDNKPLTTVRVFYGKELLVEEIVRKDSPFFTMKIVDVALALLRKKESLLSYLFHFKNFRELLMLPARTVEMEEAGRELTMVRQAIRELKEKYDAREVGE